MDTVPAEPGALHPALQPGLSLLRTRPSRAWSLIVTFYGDAVAPRGGSLWLGTLTALLAELGYGPGVVRTAMSRLAADGWVERTARGRNSHYRLTERGRETFGAASGHIYDPHPPAWDGRLTLLLEDVEEGGRDALRARLAEAGFGSPAPGLWIAPRREAPLPKGLFRLEATLVEGEAARLAAATWPLARLAQSYTHFIEAFAPLRRALEAGEAFAPPEAMAARLLLIHEYRRIILRDPILPAELLPAHWPGGEARALCRIVYPQLLAPSERWLDEHGENEDGPLPAAGPALARRFA
ncbi:phenylacetic acid degradation operon negative regulatory protein PaaX [Aureimonas populi]|uniref:Phenylacetic acid degradation operon negative regulatory protein PaaX n=1 Tax=Aureimonas populi TaxID=1701758 RepID=A0ABW5CGT7_9HYPH|nr:phenylacetic acid degradation operon negative regulatory protein PaaX [Aureimonas populi]